ncbi:hypothetical protein MBCUT_07650 [Methanobrevibacter cuticularis]|uniref:Uncharacterized protein n=2 Tax=Methanobrevibacter cuticularis TaxID=47311 RepID=A0A166EDC0_9EURY|nr:hypothetical protein MBCUT_07650 [Methanobrevibacter cuticularis]
MVSDDENRNKIEALMNETLDKYPSVDGLEDVLDSVRCLLDSDYYRDLGKHNHKVSEFYRDNFPILMISDDIAEDIPQIGHSKRNLYDPNIFLLFLPRRFGKDITLIDYSQLIKLVFLILSFRGDDCSHVSVFSLANRVMVLLSDFDKDFAFDGPDNEFFSKLNNLKWDKGAKNLLKMIIEIFYRKDKILFSSFFEMFVGSLVGPSEGSLFLLSGCCALKGGREIMIFEDVICAFKTYLKLMSFD